MKKIICRCLVCLLLLTLTAGLFLRLHQVFNYKYYDGPSQLSAFYELPGNTVDVLNLGSSRMFENVNPAILWDDYGIASFDLCASSQPLWNTYYFLKEALKTQSPRLILLDTYFTSMTTDYIGDNAVTIKSVYQLKPSLDKLQALRVSVPEEDFTSLLLEPAQYHGRYTDLSKNDFTSENAYCWETQPDPLSSWKGYTANFTQTSFAPRTADAGTTECAPLYPKTEEYLRKIIELAQDSGCQIMLMQSPFPDDQHDCPEIMNEVARIAGEYDVPFVDFDVLCREAMDYTTDFADIVHMSVTGSTRFSHYLGDYLHANYDLPDRWGEEAYASWEQNSICFAAKCTDWQVRTSATDVESYLTQLSALPDSYLFVLSLNGAWQNDALDLKGILERFGLSGVRAEGDAWILRADWEVLAGSADNTGYPLMFSDKTMEIAVDQSGIYENGTRLNKTENGLNLVVYDTVSHYVADIAGYDAASGYALIR